MCTNLIEKKIIKEETNIEQIKVTAITNKNWKMGENWQKGLLI